jgi:hypothetical protein
MNQHVRSGRLATLFAMLTLLIVAAGPAQASTQPAGTGTVKTSSVDDKKDSKRLELRKVRVKDPKTGKVNTIKVTVAEGDDAAGLRKNSGRWQWVWNGARWVVKWVVRVCAWTACWNIIYW